MARIRTIKPEFFRHEALQDLEIANPGKYPMMVFEALWGHCDSKGRFEWKPRMLKLDILPFIPFDMADTLSILENAGMLHRYTVDGKEYGLIETFEKHQRLSGKELTEGEKFPSAPCELTGKQRGSVGEIPESQEGKGREEEGNEAIASVAGKPAAVVAAQTTCPADDLIDLYHELMPLNPPVRIINESRRKAIRARWKEASLLTCSPFGYSNRQDGILAWRKFFEVCAESEFLTGRAQAMPGKPPFVADIDFLFSPSGFAKCLENKYHREAA